VINLEKIKNYNNKFNFLKHAILLSPKIHQLQAIKNLNTKNIMKLKHHKALFFINMIVLQKLILKIHIHLHINNFRIIIILDYKGNTLQTFLFIKLLKHHKRII
jgi:hypothetical protein